MPLENLLGGLALDASIQTLIADINSGDASALAKLEAIRALLAGHIAVTPVDGLGAEYTPSNRLPVDVGDLTVQNLNVAFPPSVISTLNSRSTPLAANELWVGSAEDVLRYSAITAFIYTDAPGAVNGASVEFSPDGATWVSAGSTTIPGGVALSFRIGPEARYFRFRYQNGPTAQTVLVAQVMLHYNTPIPVHMPVGSMTTDATLAQTTIAHLHGRADTGAWYPIPINETFSELRVRDTATQLDIFGLLMMGQPTNQSEVHLDDANWATYGSETKSGAGSGATQALGRVAFTAGTSANGSYRFTATDTVKYIPGHGIYGMMTAAFTVPPTNAADRAWMWLLGDAATGNGIAVGYKGTAFGVVYYKGGVEVAFTPLASWDLGEYAQGGVAQTFDPAKGQIYRVECGLLGYAGWSLFVFSPDHRWVRVAQYNGVNASDEPVFTNFDLGQRVEITKSASDATAPTIKSACWAGGATSSHRRITDPLSDRSLADVVRNVPWLKATNGNYVPQASTNNGRALVSNDSIYTDGAAFTGGSAGVVAGTTLAGVVQALLTAADGTLLVDRDSDGMNRNVLAQTATVSPGSPLTVTPTAGKAIRLYWITSVPSPDAPTAGRVTVTLGGKGEIYRAVALGHRQRFDGAVNGTLVVTASDATHEVTVHYEEI